MQNLMTTSLDFAGGARPDVGHFYQERRIDARVGTLRSMPAPHGFQSMRLSAIFAAFVAGLPPNCLLVQPRLVPCLGPSTVEPSDAQASTAPAKREKRYENHITSFRRRDD